MGRKTEPPSELSCICRPVACAVLVIAVYNILRSIGGILLLFLGPPSFAHTSTTRILLLFRALMGLVWGTSAIGSVICFK